MNVPPSDPAGVALLDACEQTGIPRAKFNDGTTVINGANFFQINRRSDGTRSSSSVSYIHPIMDRENFTLLTGFRARQLVFDADKRCTGVDVVDSAFGRTHRLNAHREVILSTGAIDSPKLLMLSGIGPAEHLAQHGIEVLVDSPGVGEHLQDHPEGVVQFEAKQPMVQTSTQWWEIGIFTPTEEGLDRPDLMMHYGSVPFDMNTLRLRLPHHGERLQPDPERHPRPFPRDRQAAQPGLPRQAHGGSPLLHRSRRPRHARHGGRHPQGPRNRRPAGHGRMDRPGALARRRGTERRGAAGLHPQNPQHRVPPRGHRPHGSRDDDGMSPLDPELRVKGVTGLRVADASVMPEHVTVNPNITVMMIGERCADLIDPDSRPRGNHDGGSRLQLVVA